MGFVKMSGIGSHIVCSSGLKFGMEEPIHPDKVNPRFRRPISRVQGSVQPKPCIQGKTV